MLNKSETRQSQMHLAKRHQILAPYFQPKGAIHQRKLQLCEQLRAQHKVQAPHALPKHAQFNPQLCMHTQTHIPWDRHESRRRVSDSMHG